MVSGVGQGSRGWERGTYTLLVCPAGFGGFVGGHGWLLGMVVGLEDGVVVCDGGGTEGS